MDKQDTRAEQIIAIKLVAREGANNDWTLYYGPAELADHLVRTHGYKLTKPTALALVSAGILDYNWFRKEYRD